MSKRAPFVIANWKLNGGIDLTRTSVASMLTKQFDIRIGIAPPYVYIGDMVNFLRNSPIMVGSQNLSKFASGAFTGETSAQMLHEVGCEFCLIGHSERRQVFLENDHSCRAKLEKALENDLMPILCIGENLQQYDLGLTNDILYRQLHQTISGLDIGEKTLCIAYEPIWAIGTGKAATTDQVKAVHGFIFRELVEILGAKRANQVHILYGGSVTKNNVGGLLGTDHVDGVLVGGASLDPEHFSEICAIANQTVQ